jgi:hypothetical protein
MLNFTSVKKILLFLSKTISQLQTTLTTMLAQIFQSMRAINFMTTKTFNSKGLFSSWENMSKKNLAAALSFDSKSNATTAPLTTKTSVVFLPFQLLNYVYTNLSYEKYNSIWMRFFGVGFFYLSYSCFIMYIDACLTDDEPLWEPIEWSLVQTWILFLFTFAWIAENLIVSRYGSYTGRDKRVWFAWYKTFWLCEGYYIINFGAVVLLVIVPYYYETNYDVSFLFSWWHWYSRVFFFKFISLFSLILILALVLQMSVRWLFWKKSLLLIIFINIFIGYLLYTHFIMAFFGYFTDPVWYQKTRSIDYVQLSHEPARWGWGPAKKDHFTYHGVRTVFWFKNDGPYASAFLLLHLYLFLSLFFLYIYWITLFRRVYSTCEVPLTLTTYCVSSLKQFFYLFLMMYLFIFLSYISHYLRYPVEALWTLNTPYWLTNFFIILKDYYTLFFTN